MNIPKVLQKPEDYLHIMALAMTQRYQHRQIEPPTETDAYADGDVIFAPIEVPITLVNNDTFLLDTLLLVDDDELKKAVDLVFLRSELSIGAVNAAATLPSAGSADLLGIVKIANTEYADQGDFSTVQKTGLGLILSAADGAESIWVAGIAREAVTYTSEDGLGLSLGFRLN